MPAEFRWIMTALGLAKRAVAEAGGTPIDMRTSVFVVGDGNGAYHEPEAMLPAGVLHEVWRGAMNRVYVHEVEDNLMVCEALIPLAAGPFEVREAHIEDAAGDVIAVGKYPMFTKPDPASGGARAEYVRGGFRISNGGATVLTIDNSVVMATKEYVDTHALLTNPHGSTSAATPDRLMLRDAAGRAKVAAPSAADDIARKDTVDAAIAALMNAPPAALDTLFELATALGNDPNFATTMTNALAGKIAHALATAENDFLVAAGAGSFIKKTLAEVKAILGLGTAAGLNSEQVLYGSPNSNGVTNWAAGINDITKAGPYYVQSNLIGTPTNSSGFCLHIAHSDNTTYAVQYFTTTATDDLWFRQKTGTWNSWQKVQIHIDRTWVNVTGSRGLNTVYQNTTGHPIEVLVSCTSGSSSNTTTLFVGVTSGSLVSVGSTGNTYSGGACAATINAEVPDGHYYKVTSGALASWCELS